MVRIKPDVSEKHISIFFRLEKKDKKENTGCRSQLEWI
jgi:hypothetical protein